MSNKKNNLKEMLETDAIQTTRPVDGVALITICSQPLGVLRFGVKRALQAALENLEADRTVHCLVLTGVEKAFSVGSDIKDFSTEIGWLLENDYVEAGLNAAIENSRLPVIAAVNGFAMGGGAVLTLACDIRMAAKSAKFGFPEVKVGAFASGSGTQRLPRLVGRGRALDLLMTGRTIDGDEALRIGLVEYLVPDNELLDRALALASTIGANAASAVSASKFCINVGLRDGFEAGLAAEREMRIQTGRGPDSIEGRNAFLEKRKPDFRE
ncbi:MAG: enoyl-CoA hydratase/isomerase family protein [Anaerolineales bacterium]|jgi:enoyl-CoA hydratase/carnithine racemase